MHGGLRRRSVAAAFLASTLGAATVARADAVVPSPPIAVDVELSGAGEQTDALFDAIREPLSRLGLEVHAAPGAPGTKLVVQVDLSSRYDAIVVVHGGPTEIRRTVPRDGPPNVVRDEIAEAVRSSVEAELLAEQAPPSPAPAPPQPAAPPGLVPVVVQPDHVAPPAATSAFALDVATLAGIGPIAGNADLTPHIGGGLVASSRSRLRPSIAVTATYVVPFTTHFDEVAADTTIVTVRAVPSIEVWRSTALALDVGAGAGIDVVSVHASVQPPSLNISRFDESRVDPMLTGLAIGYVSLTPGVALTLVVGAEWDLFPREFQVGGPGGGDILRPWRVRPVALAGFTFTALGSGLFSGRGP